jgi:hypothetical protein
MNTSSMTVEGIEAAARQCGKRCPLLDIDVRVLESPAAGLDHRPVVSKYFSTDDWNLEDFEKISQGVLVNFSAAANPNDLSKTSVWFVSSGDYAIGFVRRWLLGDNSDFGCDFDPNQAVHIEKFSWHELEKNGAPASPRSEDDVPDWPKTLAEDLDLIADECVCDFVFGPALQSFFRQIGVQVELVDEDARVEQATTHKGGDKRVFEKRVWRLKHSGRSGLAADFVCLLADRHGASIRLLEVYSQNEEVGSIMEADFNEPGQMLDWLNAAYAP